MYKGKQYIVVGVGGTASTDGGRGCVEALETLGVTIDVPLVAACDVLVRFGEAPARFGPQKGASHAQVTVLERRLAATADWYRDRFGGARFVAEAIDLAGALDGADLIVTGEGSLDSGTLDGKVVRTVLDARPTVPALVLAGRADDDTGRALARARPGALDVVVLDDGRPGRTASAIAHVVALHLDALAAASTP